MAHLGLLALLLALYPKVLISPAVRREIKPEPAFKDLRRTPWLHVEAPRDKRAVNDLMSGSKRGLGEAEAIVLAGEQQARLLIDEERGRRIAVRRGIPATGVLGILLVAKSQHLIPAVGPVIEQLRSDGFHLGDELIARVLHLAGEAP